MNPKLQIFIARVIGVIFLIIGVLVLLSLIVSCSPYAATVTTVTLTPTPSPIETILSIKPPVLPSPIPNRCTVTGETVYLRSGPGKSFAVIEVLTAGQVLTVIERGDWYEVETSQHVNGWVSARYCR